MRNLTDRGRLQFFNCTLISAFPHGATDTKRQTAIGALIAGCGSYPTNVKSSNRKSWMFFTAGFNSMRGERTRFARQLFARLLEVVPVKVEIAEGVDEFTAR